MKRKQPIRKVSTKRAKQMREYKTYRIDYLFEHPNCECIGCFTRSTDIHHKRGRSGALLTDKEFFLATCRPCHVKIENEPVFAKKMGYSVSRLEI